MCHDIKNESEYSVNRRDNFTTKTSRILAQRCAYRCSNPTCKKITIGAANSRPDKAVSIGQACHIEAASAGGPRYNASMSREQRKSIENGIWLCSNCSKIIDLDEKTYAVQLLKKWKFHAEQSIATVPTETIDGAPPRFISIANPAGGTGKSFATSAIATALARVTDKRVLCVCATPSDHSIMILGAEEKESGDLENHGDEAPLFKVRHSPRYHNLDMVLYGELHEIALRQLTLQGRTDLPKALYTLASTNGYEYIICDCGSLYHDIEKELIQCSTDVVIPLGQNIHAYRGLKMLCDSLRHSEYCLDIWVLYSIGYLTSSRKLNAALRQRFLETLDSLHDLREKIHEVKSVIPQNHCVEVCIRDNKDIFACKKTSSISQAYEQVAKECFLNSQTLLHASD